MLAHDKMFLQKELGGYGIVDSQKMDMYIKANWIRRWMNIRWIKDYLECICIKGEYEEPDCVNIIDLHSMRDCMASKIIMLRWAEYKGEFYKVGRNVYSMRQKSCPVYMSLLRRPWESQRPAVFFSVLVYFLGCCPPNFATLGQGLLV